MWEVDENAGRADKPRAGSFLPMERKNLRGALFILADKEGELRSSEVPHILRRVVVGSLPEQRAQRTRS